MRALIRFGLFTTALLASACSQSDFDDVRGGEPAAGDGGYNGDGGYDSGLDDGGGDGSGLPGGDARNPSSDDQVSCEEDSDCANGEECADGVCQMKRCHEGPYLSEAPLAGGLRFYLDREVVVADTQPVNGGYFVDGYAPKTGSVEYPGSWRMGTRPLIDVVGGDFFAADHEAFAVVEQNNNAVKIGGMDTMVELEVGFQPLALAAGDIDGDQKDEVFVLSQFGNYAICDVDEETCSSGVVQNGNGRDVAIGDVDGDQSPEVVMLLDQNGTELLFVMQLDSDGDDYSNPADHSLLRIDVGDADGDGIDEIYGFEDDGLFSSARLYSYSGMAGQVTALGEQEVDDTTRDLAFADTDMDDRDELVLLREGAMIELLKGIDGSQSLLPQFTYRLDVSADPASISASDFDGDSPRASLMNPEGELFSGPLTPTVVAYFPPYNAEFSDGTSGVSVGDSMTVSEGFKDSVSLSMGVDIGIKGDLFGVLSVGGGVKIGRSVSQSYGEDLRVSVGKRVSASPDASILGQSYGVVSVSCGCFHAYRYRISDPSESLGDGSGNGEEFVMIVPVGGTSTLWSTKRYNAMARSVGDIPVIPPPPHLIGDPSSYPPGPQRADGTPIAEEDMVFPDVPSLLVSDVGSVSWRLSRSERQTNSTSVSTSISLGTSLGIGPFSFGTNIGTGFSSSYSVSVGESAFFGGKVPSIPDNPSTPEDEYLQNAFAFIPYVYREHYTDRDGNDAAYYVMDFAVAQE